MKIAMEKINNFLVTEVTIPAIQWVVHVTITYRMFFLFPRISSPQPPNAWTPSRWISSFLFLFSCFTSYRGDTCLSLVKHTSWEPPITHLSDITAALEPKWLPNVGSDSPCLTVNINHSLSAPWAAVTSPGPMGSTLMSAEKWKHGPLEVTFRAEATPVTHNKKQPPFLGEERQLCNHRAALGLSQRPGPGQEDLLAYISKRDSLARVSLTHTHTTTAYWEKTDRSFLHRVRADELLRDTGGWGDGRRGVLLERMGRFGTSADAPSWSGKH